MAILLDMNRVHVPVLAGELIDLTHPAPGETAVDCTFGAGGHARLVAERLGPDGHARLHRPRPRRRGALRRRSRARSPARPASCAWTTRTGLSLLRDEGLRADLVYLDLGISSMQVDARERGFSYSYDAPLDMRMDTTQELDARAIVNGWDERRLADLFRRYGEDPNARRIAREIVRRRARAPIETTGELVDAVESALPAAVRRRFGAGHPAKRVFQAVRIAVNEELDSLDRALPLAWELLRRGRPPGRDLVPLARGPARQALPRRSRAGLRLPARLPGLRLRPRARGGAAHGPCASRPRRARWPHNPRAKSGRLRAARRLAAGED